MPSLSHFLAAPRLSDVALDALAGKSLLVTGASGLIGQSVLSSLIQLNSIHGLGVRIRASSQSGNFVGISPAELKDIEVLPGDLAQMAVVNAIEPVDYLIHGAGYAQPGKFLANPLSTLALNTTSTLHLIQRTRIKSLFLSSSEVYSGSKSLPHREEDIGTTDPSHPRAPYIEGKRAGESIVLSGSEQLGIGGVVARVSLGYGPGPRLSDQRVMNELILTALRDKWVELKGGHDMIRTYGYIGDISRMLIELIGGDARGTYNVAGDSKMSLGQLAKSIAEISGAELIGHEPSNTRDAAPNSVELDLTKTLQSVPYQPFMPFEEGLLKTVDWFRALLND